MRFSCPYCQTPYRIPGSRLANRVLRFTCQVCENAIAVRDPALKGPPETGGVAVVVPEPTEAPGAAASSAPIAPAAEHWFYADGRHKIGPLPLSVLKARVADGTINERTYVWFPELDAWKHAGELSWFDADFALRKQAGPRPEPKRAPRARIRSQHEVVDLEIVDDGEPGFEKLDRATEIVDADKAARLRSMLVANLAARESSLAQSPLRAPADASSPGSAVGPLAELRHGATPDIDLESDYTLEDRRPLEASVAASPSVPEAPGDEVEEFDADRTDDSDTQVVHVDQFFLEQASSAALPVHSANEQPSVAPPEPAPAHSVAPVQLELGLPMTHAEGAPQRKELRQDGTPAAAPPSAPPVDVGAPVAPLENEASGSAHADLEHAFFSEAAAGESGDPMSGSDARAPGSTPEPVSAGGGAQEEASKVVPLPGQPSRRAGWMAAAVAAAALIAIVSWPSSKPAEESVAEASVQVEYVPSAEPKRPLYEVPTKAPTAEPGSTVRSEQPDEPPAVAAVADAAQADLADGSTDLAEATAAPDAALAQDPSAPAVKRAGPRKSTPFEPSSDRELTAAELAALSAGKPEANLAPIATDRPAVAALPGGGAADSAAVTRVLQRRSPDVYRCAQNGGFRGKLEVAFRLDAGGKFRDLSLAAPEGNVPSNTRECMRALMDKLTFPQPAEETLYRTTFVLE
jgi:hypothetical protein